MNAKEILKGIKDFFNAPPIVPVVADAPPVTVIEATTYKLKDGGDISVTQAGTDIAAGDMVTIGGVAPAAGEYELEDGRKITVDALGVISTITPVAPITAAVDTIVPPTLEERIAALENKLTTAPQGMATEIQLQAESQKIEDQKKTIEKHEKTITDLFGLVEKLVEMPTEDPKTLTGNKKEKFDRENAKAERLKNYAEALKQNKALA